MENTSKYKARNQKVAKNRGPEWRDSLIIGKLDAKINATKLMKLRASKKLNQTIIANALGISLSTYGAVERRKRALSVNHLTSLKTVLGAEVNRLFVKNKNGDLIAV